MRQESKEKTNKEGESCFSCSHLFAPSPLSERPRLTVFFFFFFRMPERREKGYPHAFKKQGQVCTPKNSPIARLQALRLSLITGTFIKEKTAS